MFLALEMQILKHFNSVEGLHLSEPEGEKKPENFMSKT